MTAALRISENGQSVLFDAERVMDEVFTRDQLISQLANLGAERFYLFDNAIDTVVVALQDSSVANEKEAVAVLKPVIVAERRDASLLVKIDADQMKASISVTAPYGGNNITGQALLEALKVNHIIKGLRKSQLHELLLQSQTLLPGEKITLPVAFGRLPEHGQNARFELLVEDGASRILTPQQTEDGKVDMLDLGDLITVKPGQALMRRIEETTGVEGFTVDGKVLPAIAGKPIEFKPGEGTYISDIDSNILVASKSGIPVQKPQGMQVDDALILKGVNVATGHIHFDGSILIKGDVTPGMKVSATGNITVTGFVELAELKAGGNIDVVKGIIGRKQDGKKLACVINATGSITSKFAQYCEISCGQNVTLTLHALHCIIRAGGEVLVMDQLKRHGILSGGWIEAGYSVRAVTIGALAGVPTTVIAFAEFGAFIEKMTALKKRYETELLNIAKIKEAKIKLLKIPQQKRPPELVDRIRQTALQHKEAVSSIKDEYEQLRTEYDYLRGLVSITVFKRLYPGVVLRIEKLTLAISQEHGPSKIQISDTALQRNSL
ncbi:DUF342 domain-containing protein [Photobacterium nomapromontoriensis]|uniref:DUF342 domain-containing protein n=1 Tax=Photobacterium nomapromontoriensis TaxID=2910237 RepID=UPI003D0A6827